MEIDCPCTLYNYFDIDIVKHLLLNCNDMIEARNKMFYSIVDVLQIQESVCFLMQEDDDILITLLGGITEFVETMEAEIWKTLTYCLADHIYDMHIKFTEILKCHRFNLGH